MLDDRLDRRAHLARVVDVLERHRERALPQLVEPRRRSPSRRCRGRRPRGAAGAPTGGRRATTTTGAGRFGDGRGRPSLRVGQHAVDTTGGGVDQPVASITPSRAATERCASWATTPSSASEMTEWLALEPVDEQHEVVGERVEHLDARLELVDTRVGVGDGLSVGVAFAAQLLALDPLPLDQPQHGEVDLLLVGPQHVGDPEQALAGDGHPGTFEARARTHQVVDGGHVVHEVVGHRTPRRWVSRRRRSAALRAGEWCSSTSARARAPSAVPVAGSDARRSIAAAAASTSGFAHIAPAG